MGLACNLCHKNCCKDFLINVTYSDVLRIEKNKKIPASQFANLVEPKILNVNWMDTVECIEGIFILALKSKPCIFFNKNKCDIFEIAPLVCKLYPYSIKGYNKFAICPLHSEILFKFNKPDKKLTLQFTEDLKKHRTRIKKINAMKKMKKETCFKKLIYGF